MDWSTRSVGAGIRAGEPDAHLVIAGGNPDKPLAFVTEYGYIEGVGRQRDDLERLKRNPKGVRFSELQRIILRAGFALDRTRGSHYVYVRGGRVLTVVKPHGRQKTCHPRDVRDVIRFLEEEG